MRASGDNPRDQRAAEPERDPVLEPTAEELQRYRQRLLSGARRSRYLRTRIRVPAGLPRRIKAGTD